MRLVDSPSALEEATALIAASPWAAVDTEADSLHHYIEKLCLVQVSTPSDDFVIDPLAAIELGGLLQLLSQKPLILHGADFDIRILHRFFAWKPKEVFDTVIAAQVLGYPHQGLADLAKIHCDVTLSKKSQKADWSVRPLGPELLEYAANDTHYLKTIREIMEKELAEKGRTEWHRQFCAKLIETATAVPTDDKKENWRMKGSKAMKGRGLALVKALWEWREEQAARRDRPPFKVIQSETLVDIAQWADAHPTQDVALMPDAPRNVKGEHREALNALIQKMDTLPAPKPFLAKHKTPYKKWGEKENKILDELKAQRQILASELNIHPSLLANNASLETVITASPKNGEDLRRAGCLLPWQAEVFGGKILKVFDIIDPTEEAMR
ncbi:MAG: HRDC domain-containing protein [Candidatus Omnitrophica bacterium]|nr:HRDC domain-containing protein [Candidatus Omnitrophota bacterium]